MYTNPEDPRSTKVEEDKQKANILSTYLSGVFTSEGEGIIPIIEDKPIIQDIELLVIEEEKI